MFGMSRQAMAEPVEETGGQRSHQPPSIQAGQPRHDGQPHQPGPQGRRSAGQSADQTSSMLDCLNETELQTLHGYLQRIIDTSSDDLPASTAEDVKKCELLIEHLKRRRMPTDRA